MRFGRDQKHTLFRMVIAYISLFSKFFSNSSMFLTEHCMYKSNVHPSSSPIPTGSHGIAAKMKIVEEPNTFGYCIIIIIIIHSRLYRLCLNIQQSEESFFKNTFNTFFLRAFLNKPNFFPLRVCWQVKQPSSVSGKQVTS